MNKTVFLRAFPNPLDNKGRYAGIFLFLLTFAAGALSAFSMAPYHWWPLLVVGLSVLYAISATQKSALKAVLYGWAFGFGYFSFGLYWIGNALLVEGNDYAWAWWLAVSALPALLALYPALACGASAKFLPLKRWYGYLGFCLLLAVSEWLRGHLFTGFPWNLYAYAWGEMLPLLQILYFSGVYGLTFLTVSLCALPGFWLTAGNKTSAAVLSLLIGLVVCSAYLYGLHRLYENPVRFRENVSLKLVQPNIPQNEKWRRERIGHHFEKMIRMSYSHDLAGNTGDISLIIWPETALHYVFLDDKGARNLIREMLHSYQGPAYLITGALMRSQEDNSYTNSIISLDKKGEIVASYDKFHLVPFGEYIPFQEWIPLETVTNFTGFKEGQGPATLRLDTLTFSPLVCYEILFSGRVLKQGSKRPDMIINLTNDAWYGDSSGPYQHFMKARFRAIEEGIPVIRVANTGITGLFDAYGRVIGHSDLSEEKVFNLRLPLKTYK